MPQKRFTIRGVNPLGRLVELEVAAADEADARRQGEFAGLRFVAVRPSDARDYPADAEAMKPPAPDG